ncbi:MAG: AzlD domain-containing protein [Erysipelotrichaceae bacterium]|nr:AzlD domain-containing protein [Erysipelotrichaceae bacterium]
MNSYYLIIIAVVALTTIFIRFAPFIIFKNGAPKIVTDIGNMLPYAIMMMLVVYCLKNVNFFAGNHSLPEFIAVLFVILIHKLKHNVLLSIVSSTVLYMCLLHIF